MANAGLRTVKLGDVEAALLHIHDAVVGERVQFFKMIDAANTVLPRDCLAEVCDTTAVTFARWSDHLNCPSPRSRESVKARLSTFFSGMVCAFKMNEQNK